MGDPLGLAIGVAKGIVSSVQDVKTNREGCQLLADLAKKTLGFLRQVEGKEFGGATRNVLTHLNSVLEESRDAVDKCCKANFVSAILNRQSYSLALKNAATKLQHMLSSNTKETLKVLVDRAKVLKDELEDMFLQSCEDNAEAKELLRDLTQQDLSGKKELKEKIERFKEEAFTYSINKEKHSEHELEDIILEVSISLLGEYEGYLPFVDDLKRYEGWTSLHIAAKFNSVEIIEELIKTGANINLQLKDGESLLHIASLNNSVDVAKLLIAKGADVNIQQKNKATPLHIASKKNFTLIVEMLIAHNAKIDECDMNGESPLFAAALNNSIDAAKMLIAHGANINLQDNDGRSSLHVASQNNFIDVAKELIAHGANVNLQEKNGWSISIAHCITKQFH